jgi:hypothetical protein
MPKKAAAAFLTDDASCKPFGFTAGSILLTPLGVEVTVLGVRAGKLWALFPSDQESPLNPTSAAQFEAEGYTKVHESRHILRDCAASQQKKAEQLAEVNWNVVMPWLNPTTEPAPEAAKPPPKKK